VGKDNGSPIGTPPAGARAPDHYLQCADQAAAKNRLPHQESPSSYQDAPFLAVPEWEQATSRFWYQDIFRLTWKSGGEEIPFWAEKPSGKIFGEAMQHFLRSSAKDVA